MNKRVRLEHGSPRLRFNRRKWVRIPPSCISCPNAAPARPPSLLPLPGAMRSESSVPGRPERSESSVLGRPEPPRGALATRACDEVICSPCTNGDKVMGSKSILDDRPRELRLRNAASIRCLFNLPIDLQIAAVRRTESSSDCGADTGVFTECRHEKLADPWESTKTVLSLRPLLE